MANISAIKKVTYIVTATDVAANALTISILWDSPFYHTNYSVSVLLETPNTHGVDANYSPVVESIFNVTPSGFSVAVDLSNGYTIAGDKMILHAMASEV